MLPSPNTHRERLAVKAVLQEWGVSWTELRRRLGGRGELAKHLMAGRQAPRGVALAAMPETVALRYLSLIREG